MKQIYNIIIPVIGLAAVSCTDFLNPRYVEIVELGATTKIFTISKEVEDCSFGLKSNVDFTARIVQGAEWLGFDGAEGPQISCPASTESIGLHSTANTGFPRMAMVELAAEGRSDTVFVKQEGKYLQMVRLLQDVISVKPEGETVEVDMDTNLPARDIRTSTEDSGVGAVSYKDNILTVNILPNDSRNDRTIRISVYCISQWRDRIGSVLTIKQPKINNQSK